MKQDTVNDKVIEGMVKEGDLVYELQNQEMIKQPELTKCFRCEGTGKLFRSQRTIMEESESASESIMEKLKSAGEHFIEVKQVEDEHSLPENEAASISKPLETMASIPVKFMMEENCYMCRGSGETNQWLQSYKAPADDHPCGICFSASKWGMSTECKHFYCEGCIKHSLEAILNSGQFPAYCPQCRAESVEGTTAEPVHGRIEGGALSFLEQRGVITKEFQFRFIKQMRENVKEYFQCPAMCNNFLIHQDPVMIFKGAKATYKPGKCICGALVCCRCHHLIEGKEEHYCPEALTKAESILDPASMTLLQNLGKPCPVCGWFRIKNGGCNIMMCGTSSHGKVSAALKHGGCGHMFYWDSLKPCYTHCIDLSGVQVTGYNGDLRPGKGGIQADTWQEAAKNHKGGPESHPYWP